MTEEQKKRKLEDLHSTHDFSKLKVDDYEVIKLKRVLRQNMFPVVKFLRGEGNSHMGTRTDIMRALKHRPVIGKCHDFADLNKKTGHEIEMMKLCGMDESRRTLTERCNWWKTHSGISKKEIRSQRANQQCNVRKTIVEG